MSEGTEAGPELDVDALTKALAGCARPSGRPAGYDANHATWSWVTPEAFALKLRHDYAHHLLGVSEPCPVPSYEWCDWRTGAQRERDRQAMGDVISSRSRP